MDPTYCNAVWQIHSKKLQNRNASTRKNQVKSWYAKILFLVYDFESYCGQVKGKKDDRKSGKFLAFSFAHGSKSRAKQEEPSAKKMAKGNMRSGYIFSSYLN